MEQAIKGNSDAFAKLYDSYVDRVYRFIYFRVGNEQMAEDLSSQVFLKAWEHLGRYEIRGLSFGAWLFRIARNLVIDYYRTKKDHDSLEEDGVVETDPALTVDGKIDAEFEAAWLRSAMKHLTDDQRTVLTLKFIEGLSTAEISEVMGKRQGAVRALQLRGLQALAEIIEAQDE
jgi:RNA polymerase sigma-70 factor (ECF subfamily)